MATSRPPSGRSSPSTAAPPGGPGRGSTASTSPQMARAEPGPRVDGALSAQVRDWFTWLHRHPEPSFHERETAAFVAGVLRALGYEPRQRVGHGPTGEPLH